MKEFVNGRRAVIVNRKGNGNIEQAIFILKKDIKETEKDYILDEARKIVDEFVARNNMEVQGGKYGVKWVIPLLAVISVIAAAYICFLF